MKDSKPMIGEIIYKNNHVINIYEACTCCYNNTKKLTYLEKKEYIEKRIKSGHDSILEHGRLAMKIKNIRNSDLIAQLTTLEYSRYLEFYSIHNEDDTYTLIINGNMRSYKYFITNTTSDDYDRLSIIRTIHYLLSKSTVKELYGNIDDFVMYSDNDDNRERIKFLDIEMIDCDDINEYKCIVEDPSDGLMYNTVIPKVSISSKDLNKTFDIGIDNNYIDKLINDPDISLEVLHNIIPVTIVFRNMSRTATHQLVRHRNAITQESQRYVDYTNATFTIPIENYSDDDVYDITLFNTTKSVTLKELSKELMSVYKQLVDKGLKKEEARAFLPSNVNCRRLYMTFSLSNLFAFIKLRTDPHAQYEIRSYATSIEATIENIMTMNN